MREVVVGAIVSAVTATVIACGSQAPAPSGGALPVASSPVADAGVTSDAAPPPTAKTWSDRPDLAAKVVNPQSLANAIDRAGPAGVVALYARLDPRKAPPADQRKAALAAEGVGPQTVAGDLVTLRVPTDKIAILLAIPWVTSVETPSVVFPR